MLVSVTATLLPQIFIIGSNHVLFLVFSWYFSASWPLSCLDIAVQKDTQKSNESLAHFTQNGFLSSTTTYSGILCDTSFHYIFYPVLLFLHFLFSWEKDNLKMSSFDMNVPHLCVVIIGGYMKSLLFPLVWISLYLEKLTLSGMLWLSLDAWNALWVVGW